MFYVYILLLEARANNMSYAWMHSPGNIPCMHLQISYHSSISAICC